jgi:integrase
MASIVRRPNGRWQATYKVRGREFSRVFDRKQDAKVWAQSAEQEVLRGSWADPRASRMTVDQWLDRWLPTRRVDLRQTSFERLTSLCDRHIRPKWGSRALDEVPNVEVREWTAELQQRLAPRTVRKVIMTFRQILDAAVDDRRLTANPAARVPLPSNEGQDRAWMTLGQAEALREAIAPRYRVVVLLGYWCGLRFGEIVALRRKDVDVARGRIRVERTAQQTSSGVAFGPPKTRAGRRTVPVPPSVMRHIGAYLDAHTPADPEALVVATSTGTPLLRQNFTRRAWASGLQAADLPSTLTPHSMRHGFASLLIAGGFSIKEVSQWCGHASTSVTLSVYAHLEAESEDDAPVRLEALLSRVGTR